MSDLSPEQQEAIKDAPKGTFALMLLQVTFHPGLLPSVCQPAH